MSNRRHPLILVLLALALLVPSLAVAQTSRVQGMALQGDYIKDYTGIYTYMSSVNNFGNLVYGELGVATGGTPIDRSVGAVLGNLFDGNFGTWGIHLRQFTPALGQGDFISSPAPGQAGFDPNTHTNESFDLMWGHRFGTTSVGLRLNRSVFKLEADNGAFGAISNLEFDLPAAVDPNLSRNILGLGGGIGFEMNPSTNVEIGLLWQNRTYELSDSLGNTEEDDGPTTYQVAARAMWQTQPNLVVIPVFKWYSYDLSTKDIAGNTLDNSLTGWQVGAAGNWTVGSNDLFVLGLTFAQNKIDQQEDLFFAGFDQGEIIENFSPQVFAALETHVNTWLTLRFGATKGAWHSIEFDDQDTPDNLKVNDSPFEMSLGAGVKVGTLQIDAILNDQFPQNMPYLVSGASTDPLFAKVTATYPW